MSQTSSDISIDYSIISAVATKLSNAALEIGPQITDLYKSVDGLLTQDGGLWMEQTSSAIQTVYTTFNTSAGNFVTNLTSFSKMFSDFVSNLQNMDTQYAQSITNPPPSTSTGP